MKIKTGSKVRIVNVIESENTLLNKNKRDKLGKEGFVDDTTCVFRGASTNGLPDRLNGKHLYSIKDSNGKGVSNYGWFAEELELID